MTGHRFRINRGVQTLVVRAARRVVLGDDQPRRVSSRRPGAFSKTPSLDTSGTPSRIAAAAIHRSASCSRWWSACPTRTQAARSSTRPCGCKSGPTRNTCGSGGGWQGARQLDVAPWKGGHGSRRTWSCGI